MRDSKMVAVEVAQAPVLYSVSTRLLRKLYGIMPFMFALIVGVIVGTYSSVFIATPVMYDTQKKSIDQEK